jgi:hypothetical protein
MRKVFIIDSNYPEDHYLDRADGVIAQHILKAHNIRADLRLALVREYFEAAVHRALKDGCDVLHISCHGDVDGIGLPLAASPIQKLHRLLHQQLLSQCLSNNGCGYILRHSHSS